MNSEDRIVVSPGTGYAFGMEAAVKSGGDAYYGDSRK